MLPAQVAALTFPAWMLISAVHQPGWTEAFLLLGVLVIVPVGLAGFVDNRLSPWLMYGAGAVLTASFLVEGGLLAAALALPWFAVTLRLAWIGLQRRERIDAAQLATRAGLVFVAVGGAWTVLARLEEPLFGYPQIIVLLTAVHFHFAGFALPLVLGRLAGSYPSRFSLTIVTGTVAGIVLVAVGISFSPMLEVIGAWVLALSAAGLGLMLITTRSPAVIGNRVLAVIGGSALLVGMVMAIAYATGEFSQQNQIAIPTMLRYHAAVNALGFAIPSLIATRGVHVDQ